MVWVKAAGEAKVEAKVEVRVKDKDKDKVEWAAMLQA